jgi:hypothetical protein
MKSLLRAVIAALVAATALVSVWTVAPSPAGAYPLGQGYWMVLADGSVVPFGDSQFYGSMRTTALSKPIVGMATFPYLEGYWLVASDGGVFGFGASKFYGGLGDIALNKPIVGIAPTSTGRGYWLVASDGGIFAFGDAEFFGSMGGTPLNQPIVGMAATPTGKGYWLVASDGGMFAFGDAQFFGSMGGTPLNQPIVGMAATPTGVGYYMVASDGGMFTFGDGAFQGSTGAIKLNSPITGMMLSTTGKGYSLLARDGGMFSFGDAPFLGALGDRRLIAPVVAGATRPRLAAIATPFPEGDVSVSFWAPREGDTRLQLFFLSGDDPAGARIDGVQGLDVADLGTISWRRFAGGCVTWVLVYDAGAGNERRDFTCPTFADGVDVPSFRPADFVPGDARVMALQVWFTIPLFSPGGGVAEIDDITVAGVVLTDGRETRLL